MSRKSKIASPPADPGHILSVSELTRRVKVLLEDSLAEVWIRGEVSNLRRQPSGHVYFTLKDSESQLPCVFFRAEAMKSAIALRDGQQLLVFGQISVYEPRGAYQLIVRLVVEDGLGRLRQQFDALKARLTAEGLFAAERRKPLPVRPRVVGFITSGGGAAVRDFISILRRREWRGRLVILPAKVQGREAAGEMVQQLQLAAHLGIFDLLVIGRGGGSLEDLWAFNEEPLVRAVAACPIPTISAVGHETDFTLCDIAADRRAETPSAAAELISSAYLVEVTRFQDAAGALRDFATDAIDRRRAEIDLLRHRWQATSPRNFVEQAFLRLDDLSGRLGAVLGPRLRVERARLDGLERRLKETDVARILARGFVILSDSASGTPITRRKQLQPAQRVRARFADGDAGLTAKP